MKISVPANVSPRPVGSHRMGLAVALSALILLCGCSKLRLAYEYADWMLLFSVNNNFDLDKTQSESLKRDVKEYFSWHRREMLPRYAHLLLRASNKIKSGGRPDDYDSIYREFRVLYRQTMEPVVGKAQTLLLSLSPEQIEAYEKVMKKKNDKLRKENAKARSRLMEERYRKTVVEIEDWTGPLSSEQKQQVHDFSMTVPWNKDLWLEHREKSQAKLIGILRARQPALLEAFLKDYFLDPDRLKSPIYVERTREYETRLKSLILGVNGMVTPSQKASALVQAETLAKDFLEMSKKK